MNYKCPYCGAHSIIGSDNHEIHNERIAISSNQNEFDSVIGVTYNAITCPNPKCKKLKLSLKLSKFSGDFPTDKLLNEWQLLPESIARPQPDYIPKPIVEDYIEACRIQSLSPKASATLARRAMQGMIRDFFGISDETLYKEIDAIKDKVPTAQWNALDALRKIGNIGAHMEKDVNTIIDIDANEVDKLIKFIEYLFEQWYIKRHDDEVSLQELTNLAGIKKVQKSNQTLDSITPIE